LGLLSYHKFFSSSGREDYYSSANMEGRLIILPWAVKRKKEAKEVRDEAREACNRL
jgi:hypothetical protein